MLLQLISFPLASMSGTSLLRMLRYVLEYDHFRTLQIHENLNKPCQHILMSNPYKNQTREPYFGTIFL